MLLVQTHQKLERNVNINNDYVQTDDGSVQHDKVLGATTSGGEHDGGINPADSIIIDPNPSYALPQDVKLKDNPSYKQLQL